MTSTCAYGSEVEPRIHGGGSVDRRRGIGYGLGAAVYHLAPLPGGVAFFWLVFAGGFGGIINGIVTDGGQGKMAFPPVARGIREGCRRGPWLFR